MEAVSSTFLPSCSNLMSALRSQAGTIQAKSSEEWEAELQQRREELDMNMNTNANVVDQYNKRKAEVRW